MQFPADQFMAALKFVAHAAGKKDVRYYLNTVHMEFRRNELTMVATDGHRLAWLVMQAPGVVDEFSLTVNIECINDLLKIKPPKHAQIEVTQDGFEIGFMKGEWSLCEGNFPDWKRAKSQEKSPYADGQTGIASKLVAEAMKACASIGPKYYGCEVKMVNQIGADHGMHITAHLGGEWTWIETAHVKIMGMRL